MTPPEITILQLFISPLHLQLSLKFDPQLFAYLISKQPNYLFGICFWWNQFLLQTDFSPLDHAFQVLFDEQHTCPKQH